MAPTPLPPTLPPITSDTATTAAQGSSFLEALRPMLPDLSVGAVLGFATGMAIKAIGKVVLIVLGVLFITLQLLAYFDLISIDWLKIQSLTEPWLRRGGEQGSAWVQRVLTVNLPFAGAFTAGLLLGLRARV